MATVIVYLDKRGKKDDAPCPVKLAVNNKGKTALISLGFAVPPSQWDDDRKQVVAHPARQTYNAIITARLATAQHALLTMMERGELKGVNVSTLRDKIKAAVLPEEQPRDERGSIVRRFALQMAEHGVGTAKSYRSTLHSLQEFCPTFDKLCFEDINRDWVSRYIAFMKDKGNMPNSVRTRIRFFAAVFNAAIDAEETTHYPFRRLKLKVPPTRKRSLPLNDVRTLLAYKPKSNAQRKALEAFRLSFFLIGINMGDLLTLDDAENGRFYYVRAKTKRAYSIRAEPEAVEAMRAFRADFPQLPFDDNFDRLKSTFLSNANYNLQNISADLGLPKITTYWARHSWATIAASLDIPKDTIAAALGHGGNTVTDVYIDFDIRKVDDANRRVLDWVLYGKK